MVHADAPDETRHRYRLGSNELPSVGVIRAVAAVSGREPVGDGTHVDDQTGLPPLYAAIDPDALDGVITTASEGTVTFQYEGYDVTVHADGRILVDGTGET